MMRVLASRIQFGRIPIDAVVLQAALARMEALVDAGNVGTVLTPHDDHVVQAESDEAFRNAYARASLSLVDGTPVLWASRLLGRPPPAKVSGSDLLFPLMQRA